MFAVIRAETPTLSAVYCTETWLIVVNWECPHSTLATVLLIANGVNKKGTAPVPPCRFTIGVRWVVANLTDPWSVRGLLCCALFLSSCGSFLLIACSTPAPTPDISATVTAQAVETPTTAPTQTPLPTHTPEPTATPTPEPRPTPTLTPTPAPTPTPTLTPTATPWPTLPRLALR